MNLSFSCGASCGRRPARSALAIAAAIIALITFSIPAQAQSWDIDYLNQRIQPLQHALNGRMPLLAWSLPLPIDDSAVAMRNDGSLRAAINVLWSKGISPTVNITFGTRDGANATAATLQDAGLPIYLFADPPAWAANDTPTAHCRDQHYPWDFWPAGDSYWFSYDGDCAGELWPVYPLASPTLGYNGLKQQLQQLQNGDSANGLPGITAVNGMWMDYEGAPVGIPDLIQLLQAQSNGVMPGGRTVVSYFDDPSVPFPGNGQTVRQAYTGVLDAPGPNNTTPILLQYTSDLSRWLLDQSARKALTDVYGANPWYGNFGDYFSTVSTPQWDENAHPYPINRLPLPGTVSMPAPYADNIYLPCYIGVAQPCNIGGGPSRPDINQANADDVYWFLMLRTLSSSQQNAGSTGKTIAFVSQYSPDNTSGTYNYPMTVSLYQEFLRHVWLRGNSGMVVFNPFNNTPRPPYTSGPDYSLDQIEYARAVLDEMLSFRSFLDNGTPMSFSYNNLFDHSAIWSGLALNGQAVVRAVSPNSATTNTVASIAVPGGSTFSNLAAPPGGATYLLGPGTAQHRVDSRPPLVYLQFENGFQDSSGNGLDAVPGYYPPGSYDGGNDQEGTGINPNPLVLSNIPPPSGTLSVLNGAYGLYANHLNPQNLRLISFGTPNAGNYVAVPNTNNVLNAPSFTVETFVVAAGSNTMDHAPLLSKGLNFFGPYNWAPSGGFDWTLEIPDSQNKLELDLTLADGTQYSLVTAGSPLAAGGWHHVAFTYDSSTGTTSPTVTLYVDHVKQPWGQSTNQTLTGVLPNAMARGTGDNLVVGYFRRSISASFDEVRFTPEVLDPWQMLTYGTLQ